MGMHINFSGHFDYWEALNPKRAVEQLFKNHAFDHFPRGRVVYLTKPAVSSFMLTVASQKLKLKKIAAAFQLPTYQLARDEHYQCAICNPDYMD